ncbi:MAG TPA: DUF5985 family protein [Candidatus Sulfotelmatobacter sp.]|nr:DUF5985 family protein [Candidatus Sulfotelmatobacter sp.]
MLVPFMLGALAALSLTAGVFFLRFWRDTSDVFFLPFAVFFFVEAVNRVVLLFSPHPNEGSTWIYLSRLLALLLILAGILHKNYGRSC